MKTILLWGVLLGSVIATSVAGAQGLPLQLNDQNVKVVNEGGRVIMQIDLAAELKKQHPAAKLEIKSIQVEAKSRLGGGQIMLKVQREQGSARFVDIQRVDTDPAIYDSNEGFQRVELVNFERGLKAAELVIVAGVRLRNLQIVTGAADELKLNGVYAGFDASKVGGVRETAPSVGVTEPKEGTSEGQPLDIRPVIPIPRPVDVERRELPPVIPEEQRPVVRREETPTQRRETSPSVTVIETKPKKEEPRVQAARCLQNFCVGQAVYHRRTYWEGVIVRVDTRKNQLIVKFGAEESAFEAPVSPRDLDYN